MTECLTRDNVLSLIHCSHKEMQVKCHNDQIIYTNMIFSLHVNCRAYSVGQLSDDRIFDIWHHATRHFIALTCQHPDYMAMRITWTWTVYIT